MRPSKIILPILSLMLIPLLFPQSRGAAQTGASRAAQGAGTVIFAVKKYEAAVQIEPIVIISGGRYAAPPLDDEAGAKRFTDTYFRTGRQYRIVFGGGDAGSLTVQKNVEPGCVGLVAEVAAQTTARIGGEVQALATDSERVGRKESSRRAPTETERAAALDLAHAAYARSGVSAALVKKMKIVNLTATDLERDGKFELVGSFQIEGANYVMHNLFIIFEPAGDNYKAALTWYHKGAEGDYADRKLIDAVDLDGDAAAEVIAGGQYYESNDYIIYKRQSGRWREVYQGGGGGC